MQLLILLMFFSFTLSAQDTIVTNDYIPQVNGKYMYQGKAYTGCWETQSSSGALQTFACYTNGLKQGRSYTTDAIETYKNGILHGLYIQRNRFGDTLAIGQYVNGERSGIWKWYNSDGGLRVEKDF